MITDESNSIYKIRTIGIGIMELCNYPFVYFSFELECNVHCIKPIQLIQAPIAYYCCYLGSFLAKAFISQVTTLRRNYLVGVDCLGLREASCLFQVVRWGGGGDF